MPAPYPPELRAAAIADYQAGMTFDEIAATRGVGASTVGNWVRAAGVPIRPAAKRTGHHRPTDPRACSEPGCDRKHKARGYCALHYGRHILGHKPSEYAVDLTDAHDRLEDVRWMAETGEGLTGAARRLDVKVKTLERFLRRYDPACLALLIAHEPKDHNRYIAAASRVSVSELTGQTARRTRQRRRQRQRQQGVAA